jgi:hypothetical protein
MKRMLSGLCLVLAGCQQPGSGEVPAAAPPSSSAAAAPEPAAAAAPAVPSATPSAGAAPSEAPKLTAPTTPEAIQVPAAMHPVLKSHAKGVQIYVCGPKKDAPKELEWSLKAPEAELLDADGKSIGKHFAGPTWQAADGSKVVGAMKAKVDAPTAGNIPWLLVEAKSNEGQGVLAHVSFVQRVDTEGGKAPSTGCDKAHLNAETRVEYQANYYFYAP